MRHAAREHLLAANAELQLAGAGQNMRAVADAAATSTMHPCSAMPMWNGSTSNSSSGGGGDTAAASDGSKISLEAILPNSLSRIELARGSNPAQALLLCS